MSAPPISLQTTPLPATESPHLRRWQNLTIGLLFLGYAGYYACRTNLAVATPLLIKTFGSQGIDKAAIGRIATLGTLFYTLGKISNGILADFLGGKRLFLLGMVSSILCTIFFGLGSTFAVFAVAWAINRYVQSMGWVALIKITSRWFSFQSYGRAMGLISLSFLLGNALVKFFLGALLDSGWSWRGMFFVAAATLLLIALINAILLKNSPTDIGEPEPQISPHNLFGADGDATKPESIGQLFTLLLSSPAFWVVAALSFGMTLVRETFNTWTPTYLVEVAHLPIAKAAWYSSAFDLFGAVSVLACGFLTDRFYGGQRGGVMAIATALAAVALGAMALLHTAAPVPLIALVSLVALLLIGPYSFLAGAISLDLGGKSSSATAAGLIDSAGYVGGMLSGYGVGALAQQYGWNAALGALTGICVLTTLAAIAYWRRYEQSRKPTAFS